MVADSRSSFLFSRGSLGRRNSEKHVLPINARPAPIRRGSSARKFGHRTGFKGAGGRLPLSMRSLARSISSPRVLVLGLLTFLFLPSLYFFESAEHPLKEVDSRRLPESQRLAVDVPPGLHHNPEPAATEQHRRHDQEHQRQQHQENNERQHEQKKSAEHPLTETDSRHLIDPQRLAADVSAGLHQRPEPAATEQHLRNQEDRQERQQEEQKQQRQRKKQSAEDSSKEEGPTHLPEPQQKAADVLPESHQHPEPAVAEGGRKSPEHRQEQQQEENKQQWQQQQMLSAEHLPERVDEPAEERPSAHTVPPWKPPELPIEVFKDVPLEECVAHPLRDRMLDPYNYEFGCAEIEAMLEGEIVLIGNGMIRDVYLVEYEGRKLVLKVLREDYELVASKRWVEDIHRWEALALNAVRGHPHIVGLLGLCESISVSEYFEARLEDLVLKPGAKPLPITSVVSMALDAARGLQALHEVEGGAVIHFDIKPQQMMLDAEGRLKINDLNMCKFLDADSDGNTCPLESPASNPGPFRSPENIAGEPLTEKLDVYSLAMTFYSMLSLNPPYTGEAGAKERILNGIPPSVDPSWHPGFVEIMGDMWQRDPKARPSARRVADRLEILQIQMIVQGT